MLTYRESGVDRRRESRVLRRIERLRAEAGMNDSGLSRGGFAAAFDTGDYRQPVVFASCDGIGTKIELLRRYDNVETAGRDLVAVNVNDVFATGARPHLFLDYLAMDRLRPPEIERLVRGMIDGCDEAGCTLAGGESAEMPGLVPGGGVELAGFCVGIAERADLERRPQVGEGQAIFGLPSSGFHANGYSLLREILDRHPDLDERSRLEPLLAPVRIYAAEVRALANTDVIPSAMVHVSGGGIGANLRRVLPDGLDATLDHSPWRQPGVADFLAHVDPDDARKTFNMGIGWLFVIPADDASALSDALPEAIHLGEVVEGGGG